MIRALLLSLTLALLTACASTPRRVASVTVVSLGSALAVAQSAHQAAYVAGTDALIARLAAEHGTPADYDTQSAPLTAAFVARGSAIQALDAALYAAAALLSATGDPSSWLPAAAHVLTAADRALATLESSGALPALVIPPLVHSTLAALRALVGGDHE